MFIVLEPISWITAQVPPCIVSAQHEPEAADHNQNKDCATFYGGVAIFLERLDHFVEKHDKSFVAGFTVVLAISTILLWISTHDLQATTVKLWEAGEEQLKIARISADAAKESARITSTAFDLSHQPGFIYVLHRLDGVKNGQYPDAAIKIENVGSGVAYEIGVRMFVEVISNEKLALPFRIKKPKSQNLVYAPKEDFYVSAVAAEKMTDDVIADIEAERATLCLWGALTCESKIGNDRKMQGFCLGVSGIRLADKKPVWVNVVFEFED
jgi:hypothetical protein